MSKDYNINYIDNSSIIVLDTPDSDIQYIENVMLLSENEVYFGTGAEINLTNAVFEDIDLIGDEFSLDLIEEQLQLLNEDIVINKELSSVVQLPNNSEVAITLVIELEGFTRKIVRRVEL